MVKYNEKIIEIKGRYNMNLKESLTQLCSLQKEVKELQDRRDKLRKLPKEKLGSVEASSQYMPFQKYISTVFGYSPKIATEIKKYNALLDKRVVALLQQLIEVENFIEEIQDSRIRLIIEYRYMNQYSWTKTASLIDKYVTVDSIKKEFYRFLEKN
jgi:hypothetical protein